MSDKLKHITINQAEAAQDSQLFVLNRTKPRGNVNLVVSNSHGGRDPVRIPISRVPTDLSVQAVKRHILEAPEFRRAHARGALVIIDSKSAEDYYANNASAREQRLLAEKAAEQVDPSAPQDMSLSDQLAADSGIEQERGTDIDPFVVNLVMRAQPENLEGSPGDTIEGVIQEMIAHSDMFDRDTLQYIITNCRQPQMAETASELLAELDD